MDNVADLIDPNDPQGRSYREVNLDTKHFFELGEFVYLDNGVKLLVTRLTRDCDGTPLYCLGVSKGHTVLTGYPCDALIGIA